MALNVLYVKNLYIYPAYTSKHKLNYENQIILSKIPNVEGQYYLAVKKLSALLKGITSKHVFYCLNCLKRIHGYKNKFKKSFTTKVGENIPCGYSMSKKWTFDGIDNKCDVYRGEDCIKKVL